MSPITTLIVLAGLGLFLAVFYVVANKFEEFEKAFMTFTWVAILLIVGASVYLSYATPTFAEHFTKVGATSVKADESNLLKE